MAGNISYCNGGEGTRGGLCLNCPLWCCDDIILILVWGILFVDVREVCEVSMISVDFHEHS